MKLTVRKKSILAVALRNEIEVKERRLKNMSKQAAGYNNLRLLIHESKMLYFEITKESYDDFKEFCANS